MEQLMESQNLKENDRNSSFGTGNKTMAKKQRKT
jgi:hypothetical protein